MFNESQQRYLVSRMRGLDERLAEALGELSPPDPARVFRKAAADTTPTQRKVLGDYAAQLRFLIRRFMLAQQLRDERRPPSALWSFQTAVVFARITVEELRPKYWQGYGAVDPDSAAAAERFAAELTTLLQRMESYLTHGEGGTLAARLSRLGRASAETALLEELERVICAHGLAELRTPLEALVDRAASARLEIAVFGRVSAGKSSLLNWWLGEPILPTGVTPVTAVPTRIAHGSELRIRVERARERPIDIPRDELEAYATERGNPANVEQVLEIRIEAPSARLPGGLSLVDTPGLGSLAAAGAAQTLEYLPRCDLGVLLIEAGAPVTGEDIDVARALLDGGSDLALVASKADRLGGKELETALKYIEEQFESQLSLPMIVRPVSTVADDARLAAEWYDAEIAPRLARHREQAAMALRRKTEVLRESVVALLRERLSAPERRASAHQDEAPASAAGEGVCEVDAPGSETIAGGALHERIAQLRSDFEHARGQLLDLKLRLPRLAPSLREAVARELAGCWVDAVRDDAAIASRVEAAAMRCAAEAGLAVTDLLDALREDVGRLIPELAGAPAPELARPRGCPLFDAASALASLSHRGRPSGLPLWRPLARRLALLRLRGPVAAAIEAQLRVHGEALFRWGTEHLDELSRQFDAAVAFQESVERLGAEPAVNAETARLARRDLERLERWPADAA